VAIDGYSKLNYHKLLMAIGGYSSEGKVVKCAKNKPQRSYGKC
jgi:hypothetical protein